MDDLNKDVARESTNELTATLQRIIHDALSNAEQTHSRSQRNLSDADMQRVLDTRGDAIPPDVNDSGKSSDSRRNENDAHRETDVINKASQEANDYGKQVADSPGQTNIDRLRQEFKTALIAQENATEGHGFAPNHKASTDLERAIDFGHTLGSSARTEKVTDKETFNREVESAFNAGLDKRGSKN